MNTYQPWVDVGALPWSVTPAAGQINTAYAHRRVVGSTELDSVPDIVDGVGGDLTGVRDPANNFWSWAVPLSGHLNLFGHRPPSFYSPPLAVGFRSGSEVRAEFGTLYLIIGARPESRPDVTPPDGWYVEWETQYEGSTTFSWKGVGAQQTAFWSPGARAQTPIGVEPRGVDGPVRQAWATRTIISDWDLVAQGAPTATETNIDVPFPRGTNLLGAVPTTGLGVAFGSTLHLQTNGQLENLPSTPASEATLERLVSIQGVAHTRYRFWRPVSGLWRSRQRQGIGVDGWPLRQKQNYGATGSWPLRQRQNRA